MTEEGVSRRPAASPASQGAANRIGLVLSDPSVQQRRDLAISQGVVVEQARGASIRAELRPGDVILATVAAGRPSPVKSVTQFNDLLAGMARGQALTLQVARAGQASYVALRIEE